VKIHAWVAFISHIGTRNQPRMWPFMNRMTGKGVNLFPDGTNITVDGAPTNDPLRKS
jgi:hypothetical protein